jgi:hypothetical protein
VRCIFLNLCSNANSNPASGASFALSIRGFKDIGIIAPHERFSATKLGTVFGTVYRRKHSKNTGVLRLSH